MDLRCAPVYAGTMPASILPPLYAPWIDQLVGQQIQGEPRSTCSDCAMCHKMQPETPSDHYFNPSVKCCSFIPLLPNFLVGAILMDDSPEFARGRAQFEREAVTGVITPLGIGASSFYGWIHDVKAFGRAEILLCPYYRNEEGGQCSIYAHRNARCSTWFCKYERGRTGYEFWHAVEELLTAIENALSLRFALQLFARPDLNAALDEAWGPWAGNARDFYKECHRLVAKMEWDEVMSVDEQIPILAATVAAAFRHREEPAIPPRLAVGEYKSEPIGEGRLRVWGYSKYDPLDVSAETAAALARLEQEPGSELRIDPNLQQKLVDMRVLIPHE